MKSYFLLPFFFFLTLLQAPISLFSQENPPSNIESDFSQESLRLRQEIPEEGTPDGSPRESDTFQAKFLHMLFILGLLIAFMILASWALKRLMKSKITQLNADSNIRILETRYLSPRATLYLIEVQDQTLLIAESPTIVSYLTSLEKENEQNIRP